MAGDLIIVGLAGFLASMVDGALGMGFGPTSSSILLSSGVSPVAASASVNIAKVVTGIAGGAAHWKMRNIDKRLVITLALPGMLGAVIGTTVLANVDGKALRPYLAIMLILVGIRILLRFSRPVTAAPPKPVGESGRRSAIVTGTVGAAGGVTNGLVGAWGPVVTPYLLARGIAPRTVVGCVNTAEIAVAIVASGSLLTTLGDNEIRLGVILAMLAGGVLAAPLAAVFVRHIRPRLLGLAVSGLLLLTQSRELASNGDWPGSRWVAYAVVAAALVIAAFRPRLARRRAARGAVVDVAEVASR